MSKLNSILGAVPGVLMLLPAIPKLTRAEAFVKNMAEIHFTGAKLTAVGLFELAVAILAIVPATRNLGLALIIVDMVGASSAHLGAGQPPAKSAPAVVFGLIAASVFVALNAPALQALFWPR